jgi:hypothetical protein
MVTEDHGLGVNNESIEIYSTVSNLGKRYIVEITRV